jgi:RecJ-like exonuclease
MEKGGTVVIIDVECPRCNGLGEVLGGTPNARARFVRHDDLNPDDFGEPCGKCGGSGVVEYDLNEECDDADI